MLYIRMTEAARRRHIRSSSEGMLQTHLRSDQKKDRVNAAACVAYGLSARSPARLHASEVGNCATSLGRNTGPLAQRTCDRVNGITEGKVAWRGASVIDLSIGLRLQL